MIRQPRNSHWVAAFVCAVAVHAVAMVRLGWESTTPHRAEDPGAQSITIALAPPPAVKPEARTPSPQQPAAIPEPEPLESAVKKPEQEQQKAPEPEREPEPEEPETEAPTDPQESREETAEPREETIDPSAKQTADRVQAGATGGIQDAPPDYRAEVSAWLERHKEYPMSARRKAEQGMAMVSFTFDREGKILDYRLLRPTGHESLDRAVEEMLKRADPLPKMPEHLIQARMTWTLPVYFRLN